MITIIIPVLNEEKTIEKCLSNIMKLSGEKELIVVDGGSLDNTVAIASRYARVITSAKGRAKQMNAGARVAKGDILWFVHSDSELHLHSICAIEKTIAENYIGGCFRLYFYDLDTRFMRFLAYSSNLRAKYFKLIFGDQGIFMRRDIFEKLEGFRDMELMEDWEFSRRIHRLGRMKIIDKEIGTSARRFQRDGQLKTLLKMHKIKVLYLLGTAPEKLNRIYRDVR
ncbi:TIGR04283 family arsenosugar biosynthesis glycosyltransferase [Bacillus benzoevorans]|uniref:4,4'-diaponeurosporenoate glycosyltransferase n=1 Tax=Bacillus benzoevorans TaxID=1456 RepID=A0A7X0HRI4_9BACI|nr:TIGR04283 family arsenosugar biosynthesis glycosyltransferase [Bacillus benzoevorans]MBB6445598.1 rSAM/selenodomain-associated transferase 2 [Bacillus benzoevorans]